MSKKHRQKKTRKILKPALPKLYGRLVLAGFFAFNFLAFIPFGFAQIIIDGLGDKPDVFAYVHKVVAEKYEAMEDEKVRASKVRADLLKAMKAKGYYNAVVTNDEENERRFEVKAGQAFTISSISFEGVPYDGGVQIKAGDILDANQILVEQARIFTTLSDESCIYKLDVRNKVLLDKENASAALTFMIDGYGDAKFGRASLTGADNIEEKYLRHFIKFKEGECWNEAKLENTKSALISTGLLSAAEYELPESLPEDGYVPINFTLKERAPRTIRLGAKYSTSEGPGVIAEWKHRNLLGAGEEFSVKAHVAQLRQSLKTEFEKPFIFSRKNSFNADAEISHEETEAYEEFTLSSSASIKRQLSDHWTGSLGVALETSKIKEENGEEKEFGLVSYPAELTFDNRDNVLDPHKGLNLGFTAEPFYDTFGEAKPFVKTQVTASTYFDLSDSDFDPVLALRGSWGSIAGTNTEDVPASKRFYAGGGGSIRGFGYQEAGPKDDTGDPTGGRSLLETSVEGRVKFTESVGGVAFVDAGGVFDSEYPDFDNGLFVGAGVGARYYTSFGPIRFDVAVPVNKREEADQPFQIYISIGQAF
jgi:translocation and assembly module TamA